MILIREIYIYYNADQVSVSSKLWHRNVNTEVDRHWIVVIKQKYRFLEYQKKICFYNLNFKYLLLKLQYDNAQISLYASEIVVKYVCIEGVYNI